jgi:hypothetical protein
MKHQQRIIKLALLITCLLSLVSGAAAQSTLFNVPTTDVQAPRKVYLEADFITHFASYKDGGYQTYGPRLVVGVTKETEVGVNVFYTKSSDPEPVEIQPNFKWRFYANEKRGLAAAVGFLITIPMTRRHEAKNTGMFYLVGSKSFSGDYGPRFTFGGYGLVGPFEEGTTRSGVIAAYEQPVTKKVSFVTDWFSGNNDVGYVTPGVGINFSSKNSLYTGYSIGNEGRGNNFLAVYYGYSF